VTPVKFEDLVSVNRTLELNNSVIAFAAVLFVIASPRNEGRMAMSARIDDNKTLTETDALLARESLHRLSQYLAAGNSNLRIHLPGDEQEVRQISVCAAIDHCVLLAYDPRARLGREPGKKDR
jgi:hypothetical protein